MNNFGFDYVFDSRQGAKAALNDLIEIADTYGWITPNDFAWLVGTEWKKSMKHTKGLTKSEMVDRAHVIKVRAGWVIVTPEIHDRDNETSKNERESVFITIHTNELKSPAAYISDILKEVSQIKDRTVNITIM